VGRQSFSAQVKAYDVGQSDPLGRTRVVLWTGAGRDPWRDPHVSWGLPPGLEQSVEPVAAVKLQRLAAIMQNYRAIDAGQRIVEVFGPAAYVRDPGSAPVVRTGYTWVR
jgi:hypothetical protein